MIALVGRRSLGSDFRDRRLHIADLLLISGGTPDATAIAVALQVRCLRSTAVTGVAILVLAGATILAFLVAWGGENCIFFRFLKFKKSWKAYQMY
jgi:hypothetical protein